MILRSNPECAQETTALISGIRGGNEKVLKAVQAVGGTCYVREGAGFQQPGVLITHWSGPLWWAAFYCQLGFVKKLIGDEGMASFHTRDATGRSILHWCGIWGLQGHNDVAKALVESGLDVNLVDEEGQTALHVAAKYGRKELLAYLTSKKGDEGLRDKAGNSVKDMSSKFGAESLSASVDLSRGLEGLSSIKGLFMDKSFPPNLTSLAADVKMTPSAMREVRWLRASEINLKKTEGKHGSAAHCWFPATIGHAGKDSMKENFVGDDSGRSGAYCVKCITPDFKEKNVVVDDFLPCIDGIPAFSGEDIKGLIVEKAYAKMLGSYEALMGSWGESHVDDLEINNASERNIIEFACDRMSSIMSSPAGRRMKAAGELNFKAMLTHLKGPEWAADVSHFNQESLQEMSYTKPNESSEMNAVTAVGSFATGCNASYMVSNKRDAVLLVTVTKTDSSVDLTGSLDIYSETGAAWVFVGSERCKEVDYMELEVPIPASMSPYIVLPSLGPDSGYTIEIAATENIQVRPMMGRV